MLLFLQIETLLRFNILNIVNIYCFHCKISVFSCEWLYNHNSIRSIFFIITRNSTNSQCSLFSCQDQILEYPHCTLKLNIAHFISLLFPNTNQDNYSSVQSHVPPEQWSIQCLWAFQHTHLRTNHHTSCMLFDSTFTAQYLDNCASS